MYLSHIEISNFRLFQAYWRRNYPDDQQRKTDHIAQLDRQNVAVKISDDWTFEYCLAKYGLFNECYEAIIGSNEGIDDIVGDDDTKAIFILSLVSKTDFAYELSRILQKQQDQKVKDAIASLSDDEAINSGILNSVQIRSKNEFAVELKQKLPHYLIEAIEYVTEPIKEDTEEVQHAALV